MVIVFSNSSTSLPEDLLQSEPGQLLYMCAALDYMLHYKFCLFVHPSVIYQILT